ncbi:MAG: hypothetical protein ACXV2C_08965 [Candidatus Bathyarchaeia archaeon]
MILQKKRTCSVGTQYQSIFSYSFREIRQLIGESLDKRWTLFAENVQWAAFMLDPRYIGLPVNEEDFVSGESCLRKFTPADEDWYKLQDEVADFRSQQVLYNKIILAKIFRLALKKPIL